MGTLQVRVCTGAVLFCCESVAVCGIIAVAVNYPGGQVDVREAKTKLADELFRQYPDEIVGVGIARDGKLISVSFTKDVGFRTSEYEGHPVAWSMQDRPVAQ